MKAGETRQTGAGADEPSGPSSTLRRTEIYLARQPIFDAYRQVHGYELLYRGSAENRFTATDGDRATSAVIARTFLSLGLDNVTGGKLAFINFPRQLILDDVAAALPHDRVAIEILEDVEPDAALLAAVQRLKSNGYTVALDDFVLLRPEYEPLLALADVVKVDWRASDAESREAIARRFAKHGPNLLAEKVETEAEFENAVELGYRYFQGFFFARPQMVSAQEVPAFKMNYLRLLKQIQAPRLDFDAIERIVKTESTLLHWLLKRVNSAAFGFRARVNSIRQALVALGELELRRWVSVFCIAGMGEDRPQELLVQSFVRAYLCEELACRSPLSRYRTEAFLVGMLSLLDAVLGRPLTDLVDELPLSPESRSALLDGTGPLAPLLGCSIAYERADWAQVSAIAKQLQLPVGEVSAGYFEALAQAQEVFGDFPEGRLPARAALTREK
jgi:c-di-GMP-related signal transduction protein